MKKKMKPREQIKKSHEDAVIGEFLSWYNSKHKTKFKVIERPKEQPDAIVQDENKYIWIEHADIYRSLEEAKAERSAVTAGEKPYERQERLIHEPDKRTAIAFVSTLKKKLPKTSYEKCTEKYGQGILILNERDALFNQSTLDCILTEFKSCTFEYDKGYFKKVFLGYRSTGGLAFIDMEYQNS